jgi:hypothetical protein
MFHMLQAQAIELGNMVIIESVIDLATVLAAVHQAQLAQSAQLVRHSRFAHRELRGEIPNVHFAVEQNGNDAQSGRVAEGAEQVSQVGGGLFFEYHAKYMNNCSSIHDYSTKQKNRQITKISIIRESYAIQHFSGSSRARIIP